MFFQELPSLLSVGKPFPDDLEAKTLKKSCLKGITEFSKLVN